MFISSHSCVVVVIVVHENYLLKGLSQGQRAHKVKGALELRSPAPECSETGPGCILGVKYKGRYNFYSLNMRVEYRTTTTGQPWTDVSELGFCICEV